MTLERLRIESRTFDDIDEESKCMAGYDQKYQQLSTGRFRGWSRAVHMGAEVSVYVEQNNRRMEQSAVTPANRYTLALLMDDQATCRLNGSMFHGDHLFVCGPRATFDTVDPEPRTVPGGRRLSPPYAALSVDRAFFERIARAPVQDDGAGKRLPGSGVIRQDRRRAEALRRQIVAFAQMSTVGAGTDRRIARDARTEIAECLAALVAGPDPAAETRAPGSDKPYRVVRRIRAFLEAHHDADVSLTGLCGDLGISRRALEYYFRDQVGVSPSTYLRVIRLNEARRALASPENRNRPIADIAAEAGFWHPSRFAEYYRRQFGELPSDTRGAR